MIRNGAFHAAVDENLKQFRDSQLTELHWRERCLQPVRALTGPAFLVALVPIGLGIAVLLDPTMITRSTSERIGTALACICGGLLCILYCVQADTSTLTIGTDSISSSSLFRDRTIPYAHVDEVFSRTIENNGSSTDVTTISGAGDKISFTDDMPDYELARDYITSRANSTALATTLAEHVARNDR